MTTENGNGRWWKKASFSVADIIKIAIFIGGTVGFGLKIFATFGPVPKKVDEIQRDMATKEQVQSLVGQVNGINSDQNARIIAMQKRLRMEIAPLHEMVRLYRTRYYADGREELAYDPDREWEYQRGGH